ncbi:hypothetical protein HK096_002603 [Nowakowskiella sp. JEL0078]|nr:hypothetical protein HK096_002603 [Nowakowskiella sp. JEL0078]
MPALATTIYKIRATADFLAQSSEQVSFRKGQAFYVLSSDTETGMYFVSTQFATPFSRTSVSGLVPIRNFEVVDLMSKDPPTKSNDKVQKEKEIEKEREREERERKEKDREFERQRLEREKERLKEIYGRETDMSIESKIDQNPKITSLDEESKLAKSQIAAISNNLSKSNAQIQQKYPRPYGAPRAPSEEDLKKNRASKIDFKKHPDAARRSDARVSTISDSASNGSSQSSTRSKPQSDNSNEDMPWKKKNVFQDENKGALNIAKQQSKKPYGHMVTSSVDRSFANGISDRQLLNPPPVLRGKIEISLWDALVNDRIAEVVVLVILERTGRHPPRVRMRVTRQKYTHIVDRTFDDLIFLHRCLVREFSESLSRGSIPNFPTTFAAEVPLEKQEKDISIYISKLCSLPTYILESFSVLRFFAPINLNESELIGAGMGSINNSVSNLSNRRKSRSGYDSWGSDNASRKHRPLSRSSSTSSLNASNNSSPLSTLQRPLGSSGRSSMRQDFQAPSKMYTRSSASFSQKRLNSAGDIDEGSSPLSSRNSMYVNQGSVYQSSHDSLQLRRSQVFSNRPGLKLDNTTSGGRKSPSPTNGLSANGIPKRGLGAPALPPDNSPSESILSPAPILSPPPSVRRFSRQSVTPRERSMIPRTKQFQQRTISKLGIVPKSPNSDYETEQYYLNSQKDINQRKELEAIILEEQQLALSNLPPNTPQSIKKLLVDRVAAAATAKKVAESYTVQTEQNSSKNLPKNFTTRRSSEFVRDDKTGEYQKSRRMSNFNNGSPFSNYQNTDDSQTRNTQSPNYVRRISSGQQLRDSPALAPAPAPTSIAPSQPKNKGQGTMTAQDFREALAFRQQQAAQVVQRAETLQRERDRERERELERNRELERERLGTIARQQSLTQKAQFQRNNQISLARQQTYQNQSQNSTINRFPQDHSVTPDRLQATQAFQTPSPPSPPSGGGDGRTTPIKSYGSTIGRSMSVKSTNGISSSGVISPSNSVLSNESVERGGMTRIPAPGKEFSRPIASNSPSKDQSGVLGRFGDFGTRGASLFKPEPKTNKMTPKS